MPGGRDSRMPRFEPLWDRVDRNRLKLVAYAVAFVVGVVVSFDLLLFAALLTLLIIVAARAMRMMPEEYSGAVVAAVLIFAVAASVIVAVAAIVWAVWAIVSAERLVLRVLGASRVKQGELLDTKYALKDMAIAGGLSVAPELWIIDSPHANAAMIASSHRRPAVAVTSGFTTKFPLDEQRAAFANLVARLVNGDTIVATGLSALLLPIYALRDRMPLFGDRAMEGFASAPSTEGGAGDAGLLGVWLLVFGTLFSFMTALTEAEAEHSREIIAEKADAEGLLLLKDPRPLVSALERVEEIDPQVPSAGPALSLLFFAWNDFCSSPEHDPLVRRLRRLIEVSGVEGMPRPRGLQPLTPAEHDALIAPPAPRVDEVG